MMLYSVLGRSDVDDSVAVQLGVFSSLASAQDFVSSLSFDVAVEFGAYEAVPVVLDAGVVGEVVLLDAPEFE